MRDFVVSCATVSKLTCENEYYQRDDGPPVLDLARRKRVALALSHVDDGGFVKQDSDDVTNHWLKFDW